MSAFSFPLRPSSFGGLTTCHWCGRTCAFKRKGQGNSATRDHLIPRSRGGGNSRLNARLSCLRCNETRGSSLNWVPFTVHQGNPPQFQQNAIDNWRGIKTKRERRDRVWALVAQMRGEG